MTEEGRRERLARLSIDVDTRLTDIWRASWQPGGVLLPVLEDEVLREAFGAAVRAAYAYGYRDALDDDARGRRGELARANGY
jgi:hypothetical protein